MLQVGAWLSFSEGTGFAGVVAAPESETRVQNRRGSPADVGAEAGDPPVTLMSKLLPYVSPSWGKVQFQAPSSERATGSS